MPGIRERRKYFVSITEGQYDNYSNSDIPKSYCQHCLEYGFYHELGPRRYRKEELINGELPKDFDNWLQCPNCWKIIPLVHTKLESEIVPIKEPDSNIYDSRKAVIEHFVNPRTTSNRTKNNKAKNRKTRENPEDDPDIKPRIEHGSVLQSYTSNYE